MDDETRLRFVCLNQAYVDKFQFPFICAVKDYDGVQAIMAEFEKRLLGEREEEFQRACEQVERIAWHRIQALFS